MPQTISQTIEPQDEIIVDGLRLRRALRRQGRLWLWLGPLAAGLLLLAMAALVPRSYVGTTSVALQQPSGGGSALALLTGGGSGPSKRYLGVLKSRSLAAAVERRVQLRQLYGVKTFPTEADAADFLTKNVKPDDSATDGLLYIAVSLPGPPKLALHPSPSVQQVQDAAANTANAYALGLKEYYAFSDTDQSAVLLRGADREVRQARANYNSALSRSLDFTRGLSRTDPRSVPALSASLPPEGSPAGGTPAPASSSSSSASPAGGTDPATASSVLPGLYAELNRVQAELGETQAVRATGQALIGTQIQDLSRVPTDDPLLTDVRSRVAQDRIAYQTLSALYPPGSEDQHPNLLAAKARLGFDQADLSRQIEGVKQRLTTPDVRSAEQVKGLYARQAVLAGEITSAQRHLGIRRQLSGEAGRLSAEVAIQLDVLKATLDEAAKVRLNNASSLSRMTIIDTAVPPKSGEPGLGKLAAACIGLAVLGFLVAVVLDYLRAAPQPAGTASGMAGAGGMNGAGTSGPEDPAHAAGHQGSLRK